MHFRIHSYHVFPRQLSCPARRLEYTTPPHACTPPSLPSLVTHTLKIDSQLLNSIGAVVRYDSIRVVRKNEGLCGFGDDESFFTLHSRPPLAFRSPVYDDFEETYLLQIEAVPIRLDHRELLPVDVDALREGLAGIGEGGYDVLHLLGLDLWGRVLCQFMIRAGEERGRR